MGEPRLRTRWGVSSVSLRLTAPSAEGAKGDFASAEARRWLSDRPRHPFGSLLIDCYRGKTLDGRGGSVSRRDLNQLARNRAQLSGVRKHEENVNSNPSYSSGGGPGEALLLEKRPPPEFSLPRSLSGREREGGAFRRKAASLAYA